MKLIRWTAITLAIPLAVMAAGRPSSRDPSPLSADAAATYKAKCAACHGAKAEKSFDVSKSDADLLKAVQEGVKPKMPAFEKSLDEDTRKALVAHMRELRK